MYYLKTGFKILKRSRNPKRIILYPELHDCDKVNTTKMNLCKISPYTISNFVFTKVLKPAETSYLMFRTVESTKQLLGEQV